MFKQGDRVRIVRGKFGPDNQGVWHLGSAGTVHKDERLYPNGYCGANTENSESDHHARTAEHETIVSVRWDGFDYGGNANNFHTACTYILDYEIDDDEVAEAIASIEEAARHVQGSKGGDR